MANLDISVIVICHNEERCIRAARESLAAQNYPASSFEVVVVENASTDKTAEVVREFVQDHPNMRLVRTSRRGIAPSRNQGLSEARFAHVAFTDADCIADANWLSALDAAFREERMKDDRVAAVGGPNLMPADSTFFRRAVAIAVSNYWGNHGSVQGAQFKARVLVDHLPTLNVMYDRSRALQVGGFDENQGNIAEDVDISHQLRWRGYILIYESRAIVRHRWRESIWTWAKNMEVYGKGRSWLMKKDRRYIKLQLAAPLLTLLSLLAACFFPISVWLAAPFAAYLAMTALVSLYACLVAHKPHYVFHVFVIYIVTHIAYAVGQIHGLMSPRGSDIR